MRIPPEQLQTLVAVVTEGSFDAAARTLSVTPSAVSQRIRALEQRVGRVLVVRSRPVRITPAAAPLLRLGREQALLEREALAELGLGDESGAGAPPTVSIAVPSDALESWLLDPLVRVATAHPLTLDLHRADQDRTAELLAAGEAMAAVTSQRRPVPGCVSEPLGGMRYRPAAAPAFVERWFAEGVTTAAALARAPVIDFDAHDELQRRYLRRIAHRDLAPPRHVVPSSAEFARAVAGGLGWGMLPDAQLDRHADELVVIDPAGAITVPLHWQQWDLRSPVLAALAEAVRTEARTALVR